MATSATNWKSVPKFFSVHSGGRVGPTMSQIQGLWKKACKYDGIETGSKFVSFSKGNPYTKKYNDVMGEFLKSKEMIRKKGSIPIR